MNNYVRWILRYRLWVIAVTLLVTVILGVFGSSLRVLIDPATLAPQNHPYILQSRVVEQTFGSKYLVLIGVTPKAGDIFQPAVLNKVASITRKLAASPAVVPGTIISLAAPQAKAIKGGADGFEARPLLPDGPLTSADMAALKQAILANPVYLNTAVSADLRTAAILVEMKERNDGFRAMVQPVRDIIEAEADAKLDITLGGSPVYLDLTERYADRILYLFPIAVLVIGLLHFEAFRTKQGLILPLVTALMAVLWGVGMMGVLGQPLDIFNSPTPILILAVAAGHAVQLLKRYYEEFWTLRLDQRLSPQDANREAVVRSLIGTGPVMMIAGSVAAIGFFSLMSFNIPSIRHFGIFTGMGIASAVLLEMTFIPAVRSLLRPPADTERERERASSARIWDRIPSVVADMVVGSVRRRRLMVVTAVLGVLCLVGMQRIVVDNYGKNYFTSGLPIQQDDRFLNSHLGGTNSLYITLQGRGADAMKAPEMLRAIESTQRFAEGQPGVGKTVSIVDYLKRMNLAMHGDQPGYDQLPATRELVSQYLLLYSLSGEPGDFDSYVDYQYRSAKITLLLKTGSNAYVKALLERLQQHMAQTYGPDVTISFGGDLIQTIVLTDTMVKGKVLNIVQLSVAIFTISALAFGSLLAGVIVLMPLAMAVLAVFGVMGALGIPLNIPNSLISAMAVGIGADYAIYFLYRLREQIRLGGAPEASIRYTLATAGKAALFVATAVAAGYGVLALSFGYNIHLWLSLFIVLAMVVSVLASLTLVPSLVLYWRPDFIFNEPARRPRWQLASILLIGSSAMLFAVSNSYAEDLSPLAIMQKNAAATRTKDSLSNATFTLTNKDGVARVRKTRGVTLLQTNGRDNMRLVQFLAPADIKGTASLMIERSGADDDMWIYLPALGKVRRLSASNKKDSFVGTDFSYGDIIGYRPEEWQHRLLREESLDGVASYVIESTPSSDIVLKQAGYAKRLSWIRRDNYVAARIDLWDVNNQPYKRMLFSDIRAVGKDGTWQPMTSVAENLQSGHRTLITMEDFKADQGVSPKLFTPQELER